MFTVSLAILAALLTGACIYWLGSLASSSR